MDYRKELREAEEKLMDLDQQRLAIEHQMRGWVQIVEGLRVLADKDTLREHTTRLESTAETGTPSLPTKILEVLSGVSAPIGATQIRDQLVAIRAADDSAKNLLINIHTTLKRLIKSGAVEEISLPDGSKLYRFVTPMERAINAPYVISRGVGFGNIRGAGSEGVSTEPSPQPMELSNPYRPGTYVDVSKKK